MAQLGELMCFGIPWIKSSQEHWKTLCQLKSFVVKCLDRDGKFKNEAPLLLNGEEYKFLIRCTAIFNWSSGSGLGQVNWGRMPGCELFEKCAREINVHLSQPCASDFSHASRGFIDRLKDASLQEGIEIIRDWSEDICKYLKLFGRSDLLPRPEGKYPTPTANNAVEQPPSTTINPELQKAIEEIQIALESKKRTSGNSFIGAVRAAVSTCQTSADAHVLLNCALLVTYVDMIRPLMREFPDLGRQKIIRCVRERKSSDGFNLRGNTQLLGGAFVALKELKQRKLVEL